MPAIFKTAAGQEAVQARYEQLLDRWLPFATRRRLATREGDTFVMESGPRDAPAVLLLHGTAANAAMWLDDMPLWSRRRRVIAIDIIGDAGLSAPSRPPLETDAHALWLDDVLAALDLESVSLVGISFGGWLALDYATRRPDRVERLVAINPAGVGRPRNVLLWALPLLMLGPFGRRKMMERIGGKPDSKPSPEHQAIGGFSELIFAHFRPRTAPMPPFDDAALDRLVMPVMAILGGKDVFIDADGARRRLEAHVPRLQMRFLPDAHHFVPGQTAAIDAFLNGADEAGGRAADR